LIAEVRLHLSVVKLANGILHIFSIGEFGNALAITHVSKSDITRSTQEIFEVLPAGSLGQASDNHTMLEPPTKAAAAAAAAATTTTTTIAAATVATSIVGTACACDLNSEAIAIKFVAITATDRIVCIAAIIELDECEGRSCGTALDADVTDASILQAPAGQAITSDQRVGSWEGESREPAGGFQQTNKSGYSAGYRLLLPLAGG